MDLKAWGIVWFGLSQRHWDGGVPPSFLGEIILNAGYLSVPIIGFLIGYLFYFLYRKAVLSDFFVFSIYLIFLIKFVLFLPKTEFFTIFTAVVWSVPLVMVIFVSLCIRGLRHRE